MQGRAHDEYVLGYADLSVSPQQPLYAARTNAVLGGKQVLRSPRAEPFDDRLSMRF